MLLAAKRLKCQSDDEAAARIEQDLIRDLRHNPGRPIARRAFELLPRLLEAVRVAQLPHGDAIIVGEVYEGRVIGISEQFGAFIEVSDRDGLLQRNRITDDPTFRLGTLFAPGDSIRVRVLEERDIGLVLDFEVARAGLRVASPIVSDTRIGEEYEGLVLSHHPKYGVFVEIGNERGLVPLHHFDDDKARDMAARFEVGSLVQVRYVGRWGNGAVLAPAEGWIDLEPGQSVVGVVTGKDDTGIWVRAGGRRGRMRWRHFDGGPRDIVPDVGDLVQVTLLEGIGNRVEWKGTPYEATEDCPAHAEDCVPFGFNRA
jgi:predicted RNA-binding protein with RPS1 domain